MIFFLDFYNFEYIFANKRRYMNGCVVSIPMDSDFQINGSLLIDMMTCVRRHFLLLLKRIIWINFSISTYTNKQKIKGWNELNFFVN